MYYTIPNTFARRELALDEAQFAILGIPYDSSESYRTGSRFGPNAMREASRDLEDYDMEEKTDLLRLKIADLGDLEVSFGDFEETEKRAVESIKHIVEKKVTPVIIGGEHTVTYFSSQALNSDVFYVILDAHLDYRTDYLDNRFSHASVTRRIAEKVGRENLVVVGVRSGQKEEIESAENEGLEFISAVDFYKDKDKAIARLEELTKGREIYLSVDMDVLDPTEARGVCNPEPGGIYYRDMLQIFSILKKCSLAGFDICEVAPVYDSYTSILASKLLLKALAISRS